MKFYRRFRIVRTGFPAHIFDEIQQQYPTGVRNNEFVLECQPDDGPTCTSTIEKLLALCESYGIARTAHGDGGSYGYIVTRKYERGDLLAAPLLVLSTQKKLL